MLPQKEISHIAFLIGPTGIITTWNADCQRLLGYAEHAVLRRPLSSIVSEATGKQCHEILNAPHKQAERLDAEMIRADGSRVVFRLTAVPQFRSSGRFSNYSIILDGAGAAAPLSEQELIGQTPLKEMVDFLAGTFYVINQGGHMVMWNRRVEKATQLSPAEVSAIHVLDLFNDDEKPTVAGRITEVFEHDGEVVVEANLRAKTGGTTPYLFSGSRFKTDDKYYLCGMGLDLSERRKQEARLRLRERALHASSNGIVITRCAGRQNPVEYVNLAFERITGYRADEAIGRDMRFMAAPGLDECERAKLREAVHDRREVRVLFRNLRKCGELFWNDLTITPVLDEKGVATHFIGVINDVTAAIHRTTHLEHALNHDVLTGVASRNLLWDRLEQALHVAQRNKTLVATVLIDLDNFKGINDTLGHGGGDQVLKVVARRLQGSVRDSDTVARLGGDEFVLILDNQPSLRYTLRMIERLREDMAKPVLVDGREVDVGTSMGVSIFPHDGASVLELIQAADVAMYHAKAAGRNDVHFFSADMKLTTEAKRKLEQGLRSALEKDQLFLVFQPKLCLKTGAIVGAEALLRWRHPEQGVLLPAAFLPEAEESGLIISLGDWVVEHICQILQRLKLLGHAQLPLSVNVSFRELSQKNYVAHIADRLSTSQLSPDVFELEVKESLLVRNPALTRDILAESKRLGVKLAIDQFGAGLSRLSNLQELAVSHLKIPLMDELDPNSVDGAMLRTMIGIGHNLHINVVGGGVETSAQLNFLKLNGCDEIQGNYFSEPVELAGLEHLLASTPPPPAPGAQCQ